MMNPEEIIPKDMPNEQGEEGEEGGEDGYSIITNCYKDGSHDVFRHPLIIPASKHEYPDGFFGLESEEDALKAQIAIKQQGPDYQSSQDNEMMEGFNGSSQDGA